MYDKLTNQPDFIKEITDSITYEYSDSGVIALGSDIGYTLAISVPPTIEVLPARTLNHSWTLNAYLNDSVNSISVKSLESFSLQLNLSSPATALTTITHSIEDFGEEPVPSWIEFDNVNNEISGTPPVIDLNHTYYMAIKSQWTELVSGNVTKVVAIEVIGTPASEDEIETEEDPEVETATLFTQVTMGTVTAFTFGSSIAAGRSNTGLWSFLEQQQIIILLLMIDSFIPIRISKYIEGISFVFLNGIKLRKSSFIYLNSLISLVFNKLYSFFKY